MGDRAGAKAATAATAAEAKHGRNLYTTKDGKHVEIRDVWEDNLEEEMGNVRKLVDQYHYIGMDTEFPGIVAKPIGETFQPTDYRYHELRCNVDLLKIIQLGITFTDDRGNFIEGCPCFQFNFKFNLKEDMYAPDSIDLLMRSGIDFEALSTRGIDVEHFGELLISSGLVLTDDVHWVSFSGGYDFGYLLKVLSCVPLPSDEREFFKLFRLYFPNVYDTKQMMTQFEFKGGLNKLAETLSVARVGRNHTAGSDSFLTIMSFFKIQQIYFKDKDVDTHRGVLYSLGRYDATPDLE